MTLLLHLLIQSTNQSELLIHENLLLWCFWCILCHFWEMNSCCIENSCVKILKIESKEESHMGVKRREGELFFILFFCCCLPSILLKAFKFISLLGQG